MLAIVAPGQGAQSPGFMSPWLDDPALRAIFQRYAEQADMDLVSYGTTADAETIKDTKVAQPLLVAASLLAWYHLDVTADLVAGHSVGELAAGAMAGVITPEAAMSIVAVRGRAMAAASAVRPTSMTAIVGGKPEEVLQRLEELDLTPANHNGRGQIVAAGTVEQLQALTENPPARTRLFPLSVAGAFHTVHMAPAVEQLAACTADVTPHAPAIDVLSNADGQVVASGEDYLRRIVKQVANPVRWDLCMDAMIERGVTGLMELNPAGTLTGIAKRTMRGVELFTFNTPEQRDEARAFVAAHLEKGDS